MACATTPKLGRRQKKFNRFLEQISWLAVLATSPKLGRLQENFNRISRANIGLAVLGHLQSLVNFKKNFNRILSRRYRHWHDLQSLVDIKQTPQSHFHAIIVTCGTRNIPKAWSTLKNFNCISRANIVTRGTRNISNALSTSKYFKLHFSCQNRDQRYLHHLQSLVDFQILNRISRANIVTSSTRNISKAWSTSKCFQSHVSRQYRD